MVCKLDQGQFNREDPEIPGSILIGSSKTWNKVKIIESLYFKISIKYNPNRLKEIGKSRTRIPRSITKAQE